MNQAEPGGRNRQARARSLVAMDAVGDDWPPRREIPGEITKPLTNARGSAAAHEESRRVMAEYAAAAAAAELGKKSP